MVDWRKLVQSYNEMPRDGEVVKWVQCLREAYGKDGGSWPKIGCGALTLLAKDHVG